MLSPGCNYTSISNPRDVCVLEQLPKCKYLTQTQVYDTFSTTTVTTVRGLDWNVDTVLVNKVYYRRLFVVYGPEPCAGNRRDTSSRTQLLRLYSTKVSITTISRYTTAIIAVHPLDNPFFP